MKAGEPPDRCGDASATTRTALVRPAKIGDAARMAQIYDHYVLTSTVTFEEEPVGCAVMAERMREVQRASLPWLAAEDGGGHLVGYACATPWRARGAYRFAVETSVYVDVRATRRGHGTRLYHELLLALRRQGLCTAIGGITLPNPASVALHERVGMRKVAHFHRVGYKFDRWLDVGYWQVLLAGPGAPDGGLPQER